LQAVNIDHIQQLSDTEKNIKIKYFRDAINQTIKRVNELDANQFTGARSFMMLSLTYKLYYLLAPEGALLDEIREVQAIFFEENELYDVERVDRMIEAYKLFLNKTDEEIFKSLYKVKATFAVVRPTHYNKVINFVKDEIEKIHWYRENKHYDIQLAICEYIVAYSCFSFGMDPVITDIFHVFWHTLNNDLFNEFGFKEQFYNATTKKLNQGSITEAITKIVANNKTTYPHLTFATKNLNFKTIHDFAASFLYEFINCNFD